MVRVFVFFLFFFSFFTISAHAGWYSANWLYRKQIVISKSMVANTDQTNFPVLVSLATDSDLSARAKSNGFDIMFTSSDGVTKLSHEVEKFDNATGNLLAWVKVPTLSASSDTVIYMYYGNSSAADQSNKTSVWDSNYKGVWHLKEVPPAQDASVTTGDGPISGATALSLDSQKRAFVFTPSSSGNLTQIDFFLYMYGGTTNDVKFELWSIGSNDQPIAKLADLGAINHTSMDQTYSYRTLNIALASQPTISAGTRYAVVYYGTGGSGDFAASPYALTTTPTRSLHYNSGSWYPYYSPVFQTYINGSKDASMETVSNAYGLDNSSRQAIKFSPTVTGPLTSIALPIYLYGGSKAGVNVKLYTDNSGVLGSLVANGNLGRIPYTSLDATYSWRTLAIPGGSQPSLTSGTSYWLVYYVDNADGAGNVATYFGDNTTDQYMGSTDGGATWKNPSSYFKTYVGYSPQDSTSSGYTLINTGATAGTGQIGGAAALDGSSHYLSSTSGPTYSGQITMSAWMKRNNNGRYTAISQGVASSAVALLFEDTAHSNYIQFNDYNGGINSNIAYTDTNWHHVAATIDVGTTTAKFYVDGALQSSPYWNHINGSGNAVYIGQWIAQGSGFYMNGAVDEARISNNIRSPDWIKTEYNNQNTPTTYESVDSQTAYVDWIAQGWKIKRKITIDHNMVPNTDQVNFPVLISIPTDPDLKANAKSNGYDILFTESDGSTKLKHEVEKYDNSTGNLVAWVKIPALSHTTDTVIYMYYGNSSATDQSEPTKVWDSNYVAVWHMGKDAAVSSNDSTSNALNGTPAGTISAITGHFGQTASYFTGGSGSKITVNHSSKMNTNYVTLSAWVRWDGLTSGGSDIADHDDLGGNRQWDFGASYTNNTTLFTTNNYVFTSPSTYAQGASGSGNVIPGSAWLYLTSTFDGSKVRLYCNGNSCGNDGNLSGVMAAVNTSIIMNRWTPAATSMALSEFRLAGVARSADWIKAEYNNQAVPDQYVTLEGPQKDWHSQGWAFQRRIVIDHTMVSNTDQLNFPVLVSKYADSDLKANARTDGKDILFTTADGVTKLPHEIEKYDSTTGQLIVWVKVPKVSASTDTVLYIWYGNPNSTTTQEDKVNVWNSGYKGVWHLKETGTGATGDYKDSTNNANNSTSTATQPTQAPAGQIDGAQTFNGSNSYIGFGSDVGSISNGTFTISGFVNFTQTPTNAGAIFAGDGSLAPAFVIRSTKKLGLAQESVTWIATGNTVLNSGQWYHAAVTYDGTNWKFYLNGAADGSGSNAYTFTAHNSYIGKYLSPDENYGGSLDEIHVSNVVRSSDWIATEYKNQSDPYRYVTWDNLARNWFTAGWKARQKITISHTLVSNTTQTNFPFLVYKASDNDIKAQAKSDGSDILFTAADGRTKLSHEIEKYTSATGETMAWVKIPSLSAATDTVIYMYYGNANAPAMQDKQDVWDANFKGVWHLPNGSSLTANDSTSRVNTGALSGATPPSAAAGQVDGAASFNGSTAYVAVAQTSGLPIYSSSTPYSVEFWVKAANDNSWQNVFAEANSGDNNPYLQFKDAQFASNPKFEVMIRNDAASTRLDKNSTTTVFNNAWHHVVWTDSSGAAKLYVDGIQDGTDFTYTPSGTFTLNTETIGYAVRPAGGAYLTGLVDEVRVSNVLRSADWIKTEYNNQVTPGTGLTWDNPNQPWSSQYWKFRKKITINHTMVSNSDQTNFPVLISLPADGDLRNYAQSSGNDIVFTASDGTTKLSHEIEKYTTASGQLIAWVRVPTLSASTDTVLWMYYGNPNAASQQNATDVWDSNYVGVWHMNDNAGNTTVLDSTSNAKNGASFNNTSAVTTSGQLGSAMNFNGTTQYVTTGVNNAFTDFTAEVWYKDTGSTVASTRLLDKHFLYGFYMGANGTGAGNSWGGGVEESSPYGVFVTLADNQFHHLVIKRTGTTRKVIGDGGAVSSSGAVSATATDNTTLSMGKDNTTSYLLTGILDEVRVSSIARSDDWIATEYKNQSNPAAYTTVSGPVANWTSLGWSAKRKVTILKTMVSNTDQTNFPVLISFTDADVKAKALSTGNDILFTLGDGQTKLSHEIEKYDNSTGQLIAWVKVPTLSAANDTVLYMYYGNSASASQQDATNVWDANYKGVWHFGESSGSVLDSTGNNPGTTTSVTYGAAGQMGKALGFDGSSSFVDVGTLGTFGSSRGSNLTVSAWVYSTKNTALAGVMGVSDNASSANATILKINTKSDGSVLAGSTGFGLSSNEGTPKRLFGGSNTNDVTTNTWHYVSATAVLSTNTITFYVDGAAKTTTYAFQQTPAIFADLAKNFYIGAWDSNGSVTDKLQGTIDEPRVSLTARSADWIKTEFNNQSAPATYITLDNNKTDWFAQGWKYRTKITVSHTMVSNIDQTNFPVLITEATDSNLQSYAQTTGNDILFTSSDGQTKLSHEIEKYDNTNGNLIAWVKVPTLASATDTVLYMYYGNPANTTDQSNKTDVWDSNFIGVWHLDDNAANTTVLNSTANSNNGANAATTSSKTVAGKINSGLTFNGSSDNVQVADNASLHPTSLTVSAWVMKLRNGNWDQLVSKNNNTGNQMVWVMQYDTDNTLGFNVGNASSDTNYYCESASTVTDMAAYHYLSVTYDASTSTSKLYIDGNLDKSGHPGATGCDSGTQWSGNLEASTNPLWISKLKFATVNYYANVQTDEVRVSASTRTADWIKTEYNNQSSPGTYLTFDSGPQDWFAKGWKYRKKVTISHTMVANADQTNFPVLAYEAWDDDLWAYAQSSGGDILFTSADGKTKLNHEIEQYDPDTGELTAWIKIPTLSYTTDTTLWMYYGNPSAADQSNKTAVWDSHYKGVWHLSNTGGTAVTATDSTAFANNGTITGAVAPVLDTVGGGASFSGTSQYITVGNGTSLRITGDMTVEAWVKPTDFVNTNGVLAKAAGGGGNVAAPYDFNMIQTTGKPTLLRGNGTTSANLGATAAPSAGAWNYLAVSMSGTTVTHYLNNATNGSGSLSTTIADGGTNAMIASRTDLAPMMKGSLDELRISDIARDANWLLTAYNNEADPEAYVTIGLKNTSAGSANSPGFTWHDF